jgi:hypothetical protein
MTITVSKHYINVIRTEAGGWIAATEDDDLARRFENEMNKTLALVGAPLVTTKKVPVLMDGAPKAWMPNEPDFINVINYLRDDSCHDKTFNGDSELMKRVLAYCHDRRAR